MATTRQPTISIGIPVWNGELYLAQTIDSLLAQDYDNFELIILDNLSTDRTPEICKEYAKKDARVKYFLDSKQRDVMQGHKETARRAKGEFFMVACDDDWYAPEYISTLMRLVTENSAIGLAYSSMGWIYPDGSKKQVRFNRRLTASNSKFYNFIYYLFFRNPIPIAFGIVRMDLHRDALNYFYRPDHRGWNHDNLYLLRLLSKSRVDSTADVLFYYRHRDRAALYQQRGQSHNPDGAFARYLNSSLHQISVMRAVSNIIDSSDFSTKQRYILKAYNFFVLLYNCGPNILCSKSLPILKRILVGTSILKPKQ